MDNEEKKQNKVNWFSRILLIIIGSLITYMVIYRYFLTDPKAEISSGIIVLLSFLILLALSEVFDNFSVGEIIKLSRTIKEKVKEVEKKEGEILKVENERNQLLSQVISLSNNFSQKQSNTNIYGLSPELMMQMGVQKANASEIEESKKNESQDVEKEEQSKPKEKRIDNAKVEEFVLRKFLETNSTDISKIFREIKLQAFQGLDPIANTSPIFDAYLNDIDKEVFIEIRLGRSYVSSMFMDRLYLMLSKIYHYKTIKKTNAYLTLILVEFADDNLHENKILNRILDTFQPALSNNLLKINVFKIDESEMKNLYEK